MSDELREVTAAEAIGLVASGARLIDVRERDEWTTFHAPEATLVPMSELAAHLDELPDDETLYIVCHSGGRSARVAAALAERGLDVVNVAGGMSAWRAAGGPTVVGAA
ncbi:rhodanese-like domain-containing protein [Galbitalea sp. SE-J8]|uniref:rhodanese-like domain-containing protein n=1 Tax=Galbitalea sp. SE-J8 TaxID=3054952 RepID=UPI00259C95D4|nr:rhodanese-like domain-containing protein [Galbitalea sp. SE-J8]MDM4763241.1 rhodanese-like domain-containing protein [Galbitalea sp. SE-J8]